MNRPIIQLVWGLFILSLLAGNAFCAASVDVYEVNTGGSEVYDLDKIYVQEDTVIELNFRYDADKDTTVDGWAIWLDAADTGTRMDSGDFSGSSVTVSFTTKDVERAASVLGHIGSGTDILYDYKLAVKIEYTEDTGTVTTEDGDYTTTTEDGDDSTKVVNDDPIQVLTFHVDLDPPATVVLESDPVPGEEGLLVTWAPVTLSETDMTEVDAKVVFCVRALDSDVGSDGDMDDTGGLARLSAMLRGDGDEEVADTDVSEADIDPVPVDGDGTEMEEVSTPDGDADAPPLDGDADVDGDSETENHEKETDGDEQVDGDTVVADGDQADGDDGIETLADCVDPIPEGAEGESYRIENLKNGVYYEIRAKGLDLAGNLSRYWSEPIYGTPQEVDDFWEAYKSAGGSEDGGFCFLATAAYGSYSAEDVQLLRSFRDHVLLRFETGRRLVAIYYAYSPPLAKAVALNPTLAFAVRLALLPVVLVLSFLFNMELPMQILTILAAMLALMALYQFVGRRKGVRR